MPQLQKTSDEVTQTVLLDPLVVTSRSRAQIGLHSGLPSGSFAVDIPTGAEESTIAPLPDIVEGQVEVIVPARIITLTELGAPASNVWQFDIEVTDALGDAVLSSVTLLVEAYNQSAELFAVAEARFSIRAGGVGTIADSNRPRVVAVTTAGGICQMQLADMAAAGISANVVVSVLSSEIAGNSVYKKVDF